MSEIIKYYYTTWLMPLASQCLLMALHNDNDNDNDNEIILFRHKNRNNT